MHFIGSQRSPIGPSPIWKVLQQDRLLFPTQFICEHVMYHYYVLMYLKERSHVSYTTKQQQLCRLRRARLPLLKTYNM